MIEASYFKLRKAPLRLMPMVSSKIASVCSASGANLPSVPALLKAMLVGKADRAVAQRLKKAVREGQLPGNFDVKGTAKFLISLMHGIALRIRAGETCGTGTTFVTIRVLL
jgi:hypothetical protein